MAEISFVQYLRPDGHTKDITITVSDEIASKWQFVVDSGYLFEAEVVPGNLVHFEVVALDVEELCIASQLVENGPPVIDAVNQLVVDAYGWIKAGDYECLRGEQYGRN